MDAPCGVPKGHSDAFRTLRTMSRLVLFLAMVVCALPAAGQNPCTHVATFADGLVPARVLHVSTTGSNATGDGSAERPYATISFAAAQATPGTSIIVAPGTYSGGMFIDGLAGTAQAPIWIGGAPGQARPVLQGGTNAVQFSRARYVVLHDMEVRGSTGNGINCDDGGQVNTPGASGFLVFRNLFIHDIGAGGNNDALKLSGIDDFWVLECEFARAGGGASGSLIDMVGCHRGVIAHNHFGQASANAIQAKGGTSQIDILRNRFEESGERCINIGGSTGFEFFRPPLSTTQPNAEAREVRVISNVFQGGTCAVAFVGAVDCVVSNNTIVTPHNWIFRILQETTSTSTYSFAPCGNNTFENNLVHFDRSDLSTYVNIGSNTAPATFTFRNNLWYAYDNPAASAPSLPAPEPGRIAGVNPLLASPLPAPGASYQIPPNSPTTGAGHAPVLTPGAYNGRCYAPTPSIGAYEGAVVGVGCGTADVNNDGDAGTDADIEAFFACLAGNCCATCWTADFNDDGDVGTDADIEAFFRVLAGGSC
jgi:Protein of unknown function (DUF1565).